MLCPRSRQKRARKRRRLRREASRYAAGRQVCIPPFEQVEDAEGHGVVLAAVAEQVEHRETMGIAGDERVGMSDYMSGGVSRGAEYVKSRTRKKHRHKSQGSTLTLLGL
jgi:hypothetical protein